MINFPKLTCGTNPYLPVKGIWIFIKYSAKEWWSSSHVRKHNHPDTVRIILEWRICIQMFHYVLVILQQTCSTLKVKKNESNMYLSLDYFATFWIILKYDWFNGKPYKETLKKFFQKRAFPLSSLPAQPIPPTNITHYGHDFNPKSFYNQSYFKINQNIAKFFRNRYV